MQDQIVQAREIRSARIEGLRGVGSSGVLLGHLWGVSVLYSARSYSTTFHRLILGAGFGAFVLLSLSGYLLSLPFLRRDFDDGSPVDLRRYARNRVLRVFPLYYSATVIVLLLQQHGGTSGQWWRFLTFSENFSHSTIAQVDGPMWTLVDEIHFYLLLPLIAWGLARLCRGRLSLAILALLALTGASMAVYELKYLSTAHKDTLWEYSTPANFFYFTSGMLVAATRIVLERRPAGWLGPVFGRADVWLLAGLGTWLWVCWKFEHFEVLALVSFFTIGALVFPLREGYLNRLFGWRPLVTLGLASYSLYLWHYPILTWLSGYHSLRPLGWLALTGGVLSVICALISYRVIESPFLRMRRRWSPAAAGHTGSAADAESARRRR